MQLGNSMEQAKRPTIDAGVDSQHSPANERYHFTQDYRKPEVINRPTLVEAVGSQQSPANEWYHFTQDYRKPEVI